MDVVQGQGEHKTAVQERIFAGRGLPRDTMPPSVAQVARVSRAASSSDVYARVHDHKSPSLAGEWRRVVVDKGCVLPDGLVVGENADEDSRRFYRSEQGIVLVTKEMLDKLV